MNAVIRDVINNNHEKRIDGGLNRNINALEAYTAARVKYHKDLRPSKVEPPQAF